ncbi:SH3 domain-containing protein [Bauldia sp.]|uniref:SH3 domain-containing protein n=1 Tax=Bauldia sp. TaxID=2575872 RepID=UPI003BA99971
MKPKKPAALAALKLKRAAATKPPALPSPEQVEAQLKQQLESLQEALAPEEPERPAPIPRQAALQPQPQPRQRPRSAFAPDPLRQRTHYNLRDPERAASAIDPGSQEVAARLAPAQSMAWLDEDGQPVAAYPAATPRGDSEGSTFDARSLAVAALVGVAVGFLGLTAMGQFRTPSDAAPTLASTVADVVPVAADVSAPEPTLVDAVVAAAPPPAVTKEQDRLLPEPQPDIEAETALTPEEREIATAAGAEVPTLDAPPADPVVSGPLVAMADPPVVATEEPAETAELAPPVPIATAPVASEETRTADAGSVPATSPDSIGAGRILSYAPVARPQSPANRSIVGATPPSDTGPAENRGPGLGRTTADVNMRSEPNNDAKVVAVIPSGTLVRIQACTFWCTVTSRGQRGYVYRKFVGR